MRIWRLLCSLTTGLLNSLLVSLWIVFIGQLLPCFRVRLTVSQNQAHLQMQIFRFCCSCVSWMYFRRAPELLWYSQDGLEGLWNSLSLACKRVMGSKCNLPFIGEYLNWFLCTVVGYTGCHRRTWNFILLTDVGMGRWGCGDSIQHPFAVLAALHMHCLVASLFCVGSDCVRMVGF